MEYSQTKEEIIKSHICNNQDSDLCDQCLRPWHDGICDCGNYNTETVSRIREIANEFMREGIDLNHL